MLVATTATSTASTAVVNLEPEDPVTTTTTGIGRMNSIAANAVTATAIPLISYYDDTIVMDTNRYNTNTSTNSERCNMQWDLDVATSNTPPPCIPYRSSSSSLSTKIEQLPVVDYYASINTAATGSSKDTGNTDSSSSQSQSQQQQQQQTHNPQEEFAQHQQHQHTQQQYDRRYQLQQQQQNKQQLPLLYSAIGSLEDAGNSSYCMIKGYHNDIHGRKMALHSSIQYNNRNDYLPPPNFLRSHSDNDTAEYATPAISNQRKKPLIPVDHPPNESSESTNNLQKQNSSQSTNGNHSKTGTDTMFNNNNNGDSMIDNQSNSTTSTSTNNSVQSIMKGSLLNNRNSNDSNIHDKKVTISNDTTIRKTKQKRTKEKKVVIEMFRPSSDAYTPHMGKKKIEYKPAEQRTPVQQMASPLGTISRPNFRDALRRVSMILRQHIIKIEKRFEYNYENNTTTGTTSSKYQENSAKNTSGINSTQGNKNKNQKYQQQQQQVMSSSSSPISVASPSVYQQSTTTSPKNRQYNHHHREVDGLFYMSMKDEFSEEKFITPTYKLCMVRVPMSRCGMVCGVKRIRVQYNIPTEYEIYEFGHSLFKKVQLSSECSIVCLIYIERLMEIAKVPLLANTWRPIFMCGLLLASKVWQDLSSWNIEFASVYPQYSLDAINRLELLFLRSIKWELYISSSLYAKYYFALRSLVEKTDFRQRYNRMVGGVHNVKASTALKIEERTTIIKEEVLLQQLSRSM